MDDWKQCKLNFEIIERIGANGVRSLEELSKKEGKAPEVMRGIVRTIIAGFEASGSRNPAPGKTVCAGMEIS